MSYANDRAGLWAVRAALVGLGRGHRDVERRAQDVGAPPRCPGETSQCFNMLSCLLTTLYAIACRVVMFDIIFDTEMTMRMC